MELGPLFGSPITADRMARVTELDLDFAAIKDLTGLEYAGGLEVLSAESNLVEDLSPLAGLGSLTRLGLDDNLISDLSPLARLTQLRRLGLNDNATGDLSPLAGLTQLRRLGLTENGISDLSPLADLSAMENLILSDNSISELSPLAGMINLRVLYLFGNAVEDLSPLKRLASLEILNLFDNSVGDVSPLRDLTNLVELNLAFNAISDLAPLASLMNLQDLDLGVNAISDIDPLSNLTKLWMLRLYDNAIADMSPVSNLLELNSLYLSGNAIETVPDLGKLTRLHALFLTDNSISDVAPLASLNRVGQLGLAGNAIVDIEPLLSAPGLVRGTTLYLYGNPMNRESMETHVPALRDKGIGAAVSGISIEDASAREGDSLEFAVRLSAPVAEPVRVDWQAGGDSATEGIDFPDGQRGTVEIAAEETTSTVRVQTLADKLDESAETLEVWLSSPSTGYPIGVVLGSPEFRRFPDWLAHGTILDEKARLRLIPFFPTPGYEAGQGFARVVNRDDVAGEVRIDALDDAGRHRGTATLAVGKGQTVHFNSDDLRSGNRDKGLSGSVATGTGAWRLELRSSLDLEVLAYIRTKDGFLTSMHDVVPRTQGRHYVPIFNPASNTEQSSRLRIVNTASGPANVSIEGIDDSGASPGDKLQITIPSGAVRLLTAAQLENGDSGFQGTIGDGKGKCASWLTPSSPSS